MPILLIDCVTLALDGTYRLTTISEDSAKRLVAAAIREDGEGIECAVWHQEAADLMTRTFAVEVEVDRRPFFLQPGQCAIVLDHDQMGDDAYVFKYLEREL